MAINHIHVAYPMQKKGHKQAEIDMANCIYPAFGCFVTWPMLCALWCLHWVREGFQDTNISIAKACIGCPTQHEAQHEGLLVLVEYRP